MTYNYLGVITSESNTKNEEGVLAINTDVEDYPYLEYKKDESWVPVVNNSETLGRMAKFNDLFTSLYERDWNIGYRLFLGGYGKLYMMLGKYDSAIPTITENDPKFLLSNDTSGLQEFEKVYTQLMKVRAMNTTTGIDLGDDYYRYLVSTRNLIDQSVVTDLYSYPENSTNYGNILNLNKLIQRQGNKFQRGTYTIRLVVMYVKSGTRISGSSMFDPYRITIEGYLVYNNFQTILNSDVIIEVSNGCVRVFPDNPDVTECIIYHCYLNYEKLS